MKTHNTDQRIPDPIGRAWLPLALSILTLIVFGALGVFLTACGEGEDAPAAASEEAEQAQPLRAFAAVDDSSSFEDSQPDCLADLQPLVRKVARDKGLFYMGRFAGAPENDPWNVTLNFDVRAPEIYDGDPDAQLQWREQRADGEVMPAVTAALDQPNDGPDGSPILAMLTRIAAALEDQDSGRTIAMLCSDLEVQDPDEFDSREPVTDAVARRVVKRWAPRLKALKSVEIYIVGVGQTNAFDNERLTEVKALFRALFDKVGARVIVIDSQLEPGTFER